MTWIYKFRCVITCGERLLYFQRPLVSISGESDIKKFRENTDKPTYLLTFHFHDLISVLNHLVFGLVAEGVGPGLNQVEDLVSDIWFRLFLAVKEPNF